MQIELCLKHVKESLFIIQRTEAKVGLGQRIESPGLVPAIVIVLGGDWLCISPERALGGHQL